MSENCGDLTWAVKKSEEASVWLLALNSRDMETVQAGKTISLQVVDRDGVLVTSAKTTIHPTVVNTGVDGLSASKVLFRSIEAGVYRIKATYQDRSLTDAYSLSPNIIVRNYE